MTTKTKTKVFLADDNTFTVANNDLNISGSAGSETVNILGYMPITDQLLSGIEVDQNIEKINFSFSSSEYRFARTGNALNVFDASGEILIALIPVQEDGTDLTFGDGGESFIVTLSSAAGMAISNEVLKVQLQDQGSAVMLSEPDNIPPVALSISLANDSGVSSTDHITNNPSIALQNYEQGAQIKYSLNGTDWVSNKGMSSDGYKLWFIPRNVGGDGAKTIYVKQIDVAGNESEDAKLDFTLNTALGVSLAHDNGVSSTDKITNDPTIALQNYEQDAQIQYSLNETDWVWVGVWSNGNGNAGFTPSHLGGDGAKTIYVKQIDAAGNESEATTLTFTLDTTTLSVRLANDSGQSQTDRITNNPSLVVDNLKPNATLQYKVNNSEWLSSASPYIDAYSSTNAKFFHTGQNTITVRQVDGGTTSATTSLTFTLDITAPTGMSIHFDGIAGNTTNTTTPIFKITGAEEGTTLSYYYQYQYLVSDWRGTHWETRSGNTTNLEDVKFGEGQNYISVTQTDTAGNSSGAGFSFTVDPNYVLPTPDTTPPVALSVALAHDNGESGTDNVTNDPTIALQNYEQDAQIQYSLNETDWVWVGVWSNGNGNAGFTPSHLGGDGAKTIYVKQIDAAGNESTPTKFTFTLDTTTLSVRLANDSGQSQTDRITNNPSLVVDNLKSNATLQYSADGGATWLETKSNYIDAYSSTNAKLFHAGENTISVRQVDGTTTPKESSFTFTLDNTAPKAATISITNPIQTNNGIFTRDGLVSVSNLEQGATVQYELYANGQWSVRSSTMPTPVEGYNQINVYQTDIAGNQSGTGIGFNYITSLNANTTKQEPWTLLAKGYYNDRLTVSNGSTAGTTVSQDNYYYYANLKTTSDKTKTFLLKRSSSGGVDLVATDGVSTNVIKSNVNPDTYQNNSLTLDNGKLAFLLDSKTLLVSDGTTAGTVESAVDILPSYLSNNIIADKIHGNYWFVANSAPYGQELGLLKIGADGKATSSIVKDINPGSGSFNYYSGWLGNNVQGTVLNSGKLIFSANPDSTYDNNQLWISDGTVDGTVKINYDGPNNRAHYSYNFTTFGNKAFFSTQNVYGQSYLGVTDGTDANTHLISADTISNPTILKATAATVYFTGTNLVDGVSKMSLFSTDGNTVVKMSDISSDAQFLVATPNHGFFVVSDAEHGQELWVSDKTAQSFHLVKDILSGSGAGLVGTNQDNVVAVGEKLLFPAYVNSNSQAYFISDGSDAGTVKISDDVPTSKYLIGDTLFFSNKTGVHSVDISAYTSEQDISFTNISSAQNVTLQHDADQILFKTDNDLYVVATAKTAQKLASNVDQFKVFEENAIYFTENETINGNTFKSLWYSDATTAGTHFVSYVDNNFSFDNATVIHTIGTAP